MTREEAIDNNKNLRMYMRLSDKNQPYKFLEENYIALDMAIKALEQEPKYCDRNICIKNEYNGISCDECEVTKSQEPKTDWIPVSERLPDIHNYCMKYLVTDCHRHIHTSLFTESGGESWWSYEDVIAWMPLPKPYEPQESEE